jgi:hypothetical protein
MTQEALKLARQLLWRYRHETPIGNQPHMICQEVDEAFERIDKALAQSEQEPVAHFGSAYVNENGVHITTVLGPVAIPQDAKLYTTPPRLKPLTDEEIGKILDDPNIAEKNQGNWLVLPYAYARAIEAAHGIKE